MTEGQVLFQCLQRKTNIHIIKHTNILQALIPDACMATAGVIKNNTAAVTWHFYYSQHSVHQCKTISVLSGSSHRFTVHHHIFRQPCDENRFICSDSHLLCHSLQVQLSDPVIQTVLENASSALLLLQRSLHGDDLRPTHFSQDFQTGQDCERMCEREADTVFILLKGVLPSALSLRCPWYAAEHIV